MEDKVLVIKDKKPDMVTVADVTDIRLIQAGYYWDAGYNEFDFSCKINGEKDAIHMVQQRQDDGYGLVIRSEKEDIWERISSKEAFELESKLLDEVEYRTYHNRIEKMITLDECQNMHCELMENENVHLDHVIGSLWTELDKRQEEITNKVITDFRKKTDMKFHLLDGMTAGEIEQMVSYYVQTKIIDYDLDAKIENVVLSGSRCRGIEKRGSDLDVVVSYEGNIREDALFNILHEDKFEIAGVEVDINPITEDKTGSLAEYLESADQYLKEKAQEKNLEKLSVKEKIKQAKRVSQDKKTGNIRKSKNVER